MLHEILSANSPSEGVAKDKTCTQVDYLPFPIDFLILAPIPLHHLNHYSKVLGREGKSQGGYTVFGVQMNHEFQYSHQVGGCMQDGMV